MSWFRKALTPNPSAASAALSADDRAKLEQGLNQLRGCSCVKFRGGNPVEGSFRALENLKPLGESASRSVAGLLSELVKERDAGIYFVLDAANQLPLTPELIAEVREVLEGKTVFQGTPGAAERIGVGGHDIVKWTLAMNLMIRQKAAEILAKAPGAQPGP